MNAQSRRVACIGAWAGRDGMCFQTPMRGRVTWVSANAFKLNINQLVKIRQLKQIFF